MTFEVGDKVIYPNQGVGIIEDVCMQSIGGQSGEFYMVRLADTESTVMVPVHNVDTVGMRRLSSESEVKGLLTVLEGDFEEPDPDWKSRYKVNLDRMNSGDVCEVAEVFKNLYWLSFRKSLSFREKKMYDRAQQLVISEIATVTRRAYEETMEQVVQLMDAAYSRAQEREMVG